MSRFGKILRYTTEKSAFIKLVKLPNLKAIRLKRAKIQRTKAVWWGASLYPPPYKRPQNFVTLRSYNYFRFFFNKLLPNFLKFLFLLILKRFFQWCRRIFPNLSMSKVEKNRGRVYFVYLTDHSKWKKRLSTCPRKQTLKLGSQTSETSRIFSYLPHAP